MSSKISESEFFEIIGDKTKEGTEKLLTKFYGGEWAKAIGSAPTEKVIGGISEMFWAHIEAPIKAYGGDGKGAVDSVVGAVGSLAGGVIGGPVGAVVGNVIAKAPGYVIDYFDTTNPQFIVIITNASNFHIRFTSNSSNYRKSTSVMTATMVPKPTNPHHRAKGAFIPKSVTYRKSEDKVEQVVFSCPITVHSKWAYVSFQLEAVDDQGNKKKTYDIAFKYPGGWWGESHYVGVFENSGWARTDKDNYTACEKAGKQTNTGKNNRPSAGSSGKSCAWWESWSQCHFELA